MSKPCAWCGRMIEDDERVCPYCVSAQPTTGGSRPATAPATARVARPDGPVTHGSPMPPPVPPPGAGPPGGTTGTGRVVAIVLGVSLGAIVVVALVALLAISLLGTGTSEDHVAVAGGDPSTAARGGIPASTRRSFMAACTENGSHAMCTCVLEQLEEQYSPEELERMGHQVARTGQLPQNVHLIVLQCAARG